MTEPDSSSGLPELGVADEVTRQGLTLYFDPRLLTSSATAHGIVPARWELNVEDRPSTA
jgi:hypothetical protein